MAESHSAVGSPSIMEKTASPSPSLKATSDVADLEKATIAGPTRVPKTGGFWAVMIALCFTMFLSALDLTALSTALPKIAEDLNITANYSWVGSSYALSSTAVIPWFGGLAHIFGRRPVTLVAIAIFAIGSAVCAGAQNEAMLIAGRTVQGIGGGGSIALCEVVLCDLVAQHERGLYQGLLGLVWAVSSAIGPPIGGAFADANWRMLFVLNVPFCALAFILVAIFMTFKTPKATFREKIARMDVLGNAVCIASVASVVIALTWAGTSEPWSSYRVLVPLILGFFGLALWLVVEARWTVEPTLPWALLSNRTSLSAIITIFLHGIISILVVYYLPIVPQAVYAATATQSGVDLFGLSFSIAPFAIIGGISVTIFKQYKKLNLLGWAFTVLGLGLLSMIDAHISLARLVGFQIILGIGLGFIYTGPAFPFMSSQPVELHATAMAALAFVRSFGQVFGVTLGQTILASELSRKLPAEFTATLGGGEAAAYSSIPIVASLPEPLRSQVRDGFAAGVAFIFRVAIPIAGFGLLVALVMKELPLHEVKDERFALQDKRAKKSDGEPAPPETTEQVATLAMVA